MADIMSQEDIDALLGVDTQALTPQEQILQSLENYSPYGFIPNMIFYIMIAKDEGVLSLASYTNSDDPYFDEILELAINGTEPDDINAKIKAMQADHQESLKSLGKGDDLLNLVQQKFELMSTAIESIQQGYDLPKAAQLFQWVLDK